MPPLADSAIPVSYDKAITSYGSIRLPLLRGVAQRGPIGRARKVIDKGRPEAARFPPPTARHSRSNFTVITAVSGPATSPAVHRLATCITIMGFTGEGGYGCIAVGIRLFEESATLEKGIESIFRSDIAVTIGEGVDGRSVTVVEVGLALPC